MTEDRTFVIVHRRADRTPNRTSVTVLDPHPDTDRDSVQQRAHELQVEATSYGRVHDTYRVAELVYVDNASTTPATAEPQ